MRALIADDSKTIRLILHNLLWELGIDDVKEAANGMEAIEALKGGGFDLVLLDLHMPQADGFDVLRATPEAPVLVISSDSDLRQIEKAMSLGARGYIKKPFRKDELQVAIEELQVRVEGGLHR